MPVRSMSCMRTASTSACPTVRITRHARGMHYTARVPACSAAIGRVTAHCSQMRLDSAKRAVHRILLCLQYGAVPQPPNWHSGGELQTKRSNCTKGAHHCSKRASHVRGRRRVQWGSPKGNHIARVACYRNNARYRRAFKWDLPKGDHTAYVR